jgi:NAD+ diphosphatase
MNNFSMSNIQQLQVPDANSICVLFSGNDIIMYRSGKSVRLPKVQELMLDINTPIMHIGTIGGDNCCTLAIELEAVPQGCKRINFRQALKLMSDTEVAAANRARQLLQWDKEHRFCGHCGKPTRLSKHDTSKVCKDCGARFYPRIMPAIIVLIRKDDKLLLAHNRKFKEGMYSLIAGFVEAGENLEEAVAREVLEETNIKIKNIKYFSSQSWPFPQSLMLGFTAEYDSGDLKPDGNELIDAQWFSKEKLPLLPSHGSISRKIIDCFLKQDT